MAHTYDYPRPMVTVDCLIFNNLKAIPRILLIQRKNPPFEGLWALPGGFIEMDETLMESALRELKEETGIRLKKLKQIHVFGDPGRDPRGRTISVAFIGFVAKELPAVAADDAAKADWFPIDQLPELAFDHTEIIRLGIERKLN